MSPGGWMLLLLGGCAATSVVPADSAGAPAEPPRVSAGLAGLAETGAKSLIVVQVDTLRADSLPMYGGARDTWQAMAGLDWLVIDGLHSTASWTVPTTVSLFTSLDQARHRVTHMTGSGSTSAPVLDPTATGLLRAAGYATLALTGNVALERAEGMFADFDEFRRDEVVGSTPNLQSEVAETIGWIDTLPADQAFFVHLQPMDMHAPYSPEAGDLGVWSDVDNLPIDVDALRSEQLVQFQEAYQEAEAEGGAEAAAAVVAQVRALYDEQLLGVGRALAELVARLEERGRLEETLLVVVSDHGETIGEEPLPDGLAYFGHGQRIRPELVRVPFLVYNPALPPDNRVDCLAGSVDVMPTLLTALGVAPLEGTDGIALQDGCRTRVRSGVFKHDTDEEQLAELGVSDGASALRWDCRGGATYRYDLVSDPSGLTPLAAEDFAAEATLVAEMEGYLADIQADVPGAECAGE